jgi:hypothetical protein
LARGDVEVVDRRQSTFDVEALDSQQVTGHRPLVRRSSDSETGGLSVASKLGSWCQSEACCWRSRTQRFQRRIAASLPLGRICSAFEARHGFLEGTVTVWGRAPAVRSMARRSCTIPA